MGRESVTGEFEIDDYRVAIVAERTRRVADSLGDRITRLSREGFEVDVLARPDGRVGELRERGATVVATPWRRGLRPARAATSYVIAQSRFLQKPPVLVHAFGLPMAWLGAVAADQVPVPAIFATIEDHRWEQKAFGGGDVAMREFAPAFVRALEQQGADVFGGLVVEGREWMYRQIARRSDAYFVSCRRDAGKLQSRGVVETPKLQRMEPGVGIDVTRFDPEDDSLPSQKEARHRFDCPDSWRKVVAYRGDGRSTRGTMDLLEVVARISRRRPEIGWLVELQSPVRDRVRRRFESFEGSGHLRLLEKDEQRAPSLLRAADLVVEPSLEPEVSLRAMEGAAMQRAVVGYDTSAQRAVVRDGQTGRLAPAGRVGSLTESIVDLLEDPSRLEEMGIQSGSRAHDYFDRATIDQKSMEKYDTVLSDALD